MCKYLSVLVVLSLCLSLVPPVPVSTLQPTPRVVTKSVTESLPPKVESADPLRDANELDLVSAIPRMPPMAKTSAEDSSHTFGLELPTSAELGSTAVRPRLARPLASSLRRRQLEGLWLIMDSSPQLASTIPVSITETGFDPQTITVTVGSTVVWTNHTSLSQRIVGGESPAGPQHWVYLPLVLKNTTISHTASGQEAAAQQEGWGSGEIPPGESFSHTFSEAGQYPYYLESAPDLTGLVAVEPVLPDLVLQGIEVEPTHPYIHDPITITVNVINKGGKVY